jgi:hypothetical protein
MRKILTLIFTSLVSTFTFAQNVDNAVVSSTEDASAFLGAYFSPFAETIGAGLNRGWYNTAKPHKLAGFDISLTLNLITINDDLSSFDVNGLENFSSSSSSTPTILGSGDGATISYKGNEFVMPNQNKNLQSIPIPTLNAGVGLLKVRKSTLDTFLATITISVLSERAQSNYMALA